MTEKHSGLSAILPFVSILTKGKVALSVFILLLSGQGVPAKDNQFNYLKNGVSFSIPIDWKTISDEALPDKGYYYSAESTKKNSTGLFTLVTINNVENPVKSLLVQEKNMKEETIYQESGIEFTAIESCNFGSKEALKADYESVVKGTKVSGTIYCFNCSEKTYMIFFQTGLKDRKNNVKVFRMIELTFACR
ncbi:MAG: hypothetical protein M0R39_06030 [Prolixibacteraceae bacterium]|jgi:hypothetical protein|nr:hypothetical protein [Prolixibacteraceae bacterium]